MISGAHPFVIKNTSDDVALEQLAVRPSTLENTVVDPIENVETVKNVEERERRTNENDTATNFEPDSKGIFRIL